MNYIKHKFILLLFSVLSINIVTAYDLPFNKYYARVKNKDANVRATSSTSSELMYTLKKGEDILVIGESGDWLKIKPKDGYYAYIHKDMVEDGIVVKNNVNVRSSPSLSGSVLAKLKEGDPVMFLKTEDEWLVIEVPRDSGFWIAKFLVDFLCPFDSYHEFLAKEKEARKVFDEAEEKRKVELTKRYMDVDHDMIIALYQKIIDDFPETKEAVKAQERILDTREKKAMSRQKKSTFQEIKNLLSAYDEAESKRTAMIASNNFSKDSVDSLIKNYEDIVNKYPGTKEGRSSLDRISELNKIKSEKQEEWLKMESFHAKGKLKTYKGNIFPNATHVIVKGGFNRKIICAIYSENIDLRAYDKKDVSIAGTIITDSVSDENYPLVSVEKITLN